MKNFFKKIAHYFVPKLDIKKSELQSLMGLLKMVQSQIPIKEINAIYDIYSSPVYINNYDTIIKEITHLKTDKSYLIEMGDFIGAYFVEVKNRENLLLIVKFTSNFERNFYFFETSTIPPFAIRKILEYKDRHYYSVLDKKQPPVYITDKLLKKYKIINV